MSVVICDFGLAGISSEKNVIIFFFFFHFFEFSFNFQFYFPINQVISGKVVNIKGFSPRYTAPEVFGRMMTNVATISIEDEMKSDVYSFSVIVWEMMARKIPWSNCEFFMIFGFSFDFFFKKN